MIGLENSVGMVVMQNSMRRINPASSWIGLVFRVVDIACIAGGLHIASWIPASVPLDFVFTCAFAAVAYFIIAEITGVYRSWRGATDHREAMCVLATWGATCVAVMSSMIFSDRIAAMPRPVAIAWFLITPLLIITTHTVLRLVQKYRYLRGMNTRQFAIVGVNELGFQLARNVLDAPELGLRLTGFYDDRPAARLPSIPNELGSFTGTIQELVEDAKQGKVDRIYIAFPMRAEDRIRRVLAQLSDTTASVYIVPDFFVFQMLHSRWTSIGGLPAVSVFEHPFYGVDGLLKRTTDFILASIALLLLAVPMCLIALAIKITSPGPIFFRQKRYGLDGREILVWKFRSMKVMENGGVVTQATKNDPRVTKLGAFLRKSSLDELPQLFNVLEGSMSLVGPRPHASAHNEQYRSQIEGYMLRHKVRPGITGLAQVNGWRGETDTLEKMAKRVEFDHKYIRDWSWFLDIQILCRTVLVLFGSKNAY
jgi:putative colanic acid biosynthesis UDP-glucose lipid carrier transferase